MVAHPICFTHTFCWYPGCRTPLFSPADSGSFHNIYYDVGTRYLSWEKTNSHLCLTSFWHPVREERLELSPPKGPASETGASTIPPFPQWRTRPDLNQRHEDLQSPALPTELRVRGDIHLIPAIRSSRRPAVHTHSSNPGECVQDRVSIGQALYWVRDLNP